jgi:hypothetical protein
MRIAILPIIVIVMAGCASPPEPRVAATPTATVSDPIERLVADFSASYGLWENGTFPMLGLPETASTDEVVAKTFKMTGFDKGQVTSYKILKIRQAHIRGSLPDLYTAVLVQTDFGEKIVLFKYVGSSVGWWSRVYDK